MRSTDLRWEAGGFDALCAAFGRTEPTLEIRAWLDAQLRELARLVVVWPRRAFRAALEVKGETRLEATLTPVRGHSAWRVTDVAPPTTRVDPGRRPLAEPGNAILQWMPVGALRVGNVIVDEREGDAWVRDAKCGLTPRQLKLLRRLVDPPDQVIRRSVFLALIECSDHALDYEMSALRGKLGAAGRQIVNVRGEGYRFMPPRGGTSPAVHGDLAIDPAARRASVRGVDCRLNNEEFELLWAFVSHPGEVLTRAELIEMVWRSPRADATLDDVICRLRRKLGRMERRRIATVYGRGYRYDVPRTIR